MQVFFIPWRAKFLVIALMTVLVAQEEDGEGFSTCDINFGAAGNRSIVCYNRNVRNLKKRKLAPTAKLARLALFVMNPVLARVTEVYPSENGLVWKVVLLVTQSEKKTHSQVDPYLPPKWR